MHTVVLSVEKPPVDKESRLGKLWKGLTEQQKVKSRVYRTYIDESQDKRYTLMTTSKDLHLKLGSFEWRDNYNLAKLLEEEFARNNHCSLLLLCFKWESKNSEEGFLVSKSFEGKETVFTLALTR